MPDLVECYGSWPCTTTRMLTICSWCDLHRSEGVDFNRLFTVPYFSVRSSRSKTLRSGGPSWMSVKSTDETKMAARADKRLILTI